MWTHQIPQKDYSAITHTRISLLEPDKLLCTLLDITNIVVMVLMRTLIFPMLYNGDFLNGFYKIVPWMQSSLSHYSAQWSFCRTFWHSSWNFVNCQLVTSSCLQREYQLTILKFMKNDTTTVVRKQEVINTLSSYLQISSSYWKTDNISKWKFKQYYLVPNDN